MPVVVYGLVVVGTVLHLERGMSGHWPNERLRLRGKQQHIIMPPRPPPFLKVILSGTDLDELERVQRLCILAWMKAVNWEIVKVGRRAFCVPAVLLLLSPRLAPLVAFALQTCVRCFCVGLSSLSSKNGLTLLLLYVTAVAALCCLEYDEYGGHPRVLVRGASIHCFRRGTCALCQWGRPVI